MPEKEIKYMTRDELLLKCGSLLKENKALNRILANGWTNDDVLKLKASLEEQRKINRKYVDITEKLADIVRGCMNEIDYSLEDLDKLMEIQK